MGRREKAPLNLSPGINHLPEHMENPLSGNQAWYTVLTSTHATQGQDRAWGRKGKDRCTQDYMRSFLFVTHDNLFVILPCTIEWNVNGNVPSEKEVVPFNCDSSYFDVNFFFFLALCWPSFHSDLLVLRPGSWISKCSLERQQKKRLLIVQDAAGREYLCNPVVFFMITVILHLNLK